MATADSLGLIFPALFVNQNRFWLLATAIISILFFQGGGLYKARLHLSVLDEIPALVMRTVAAAAIVTGIITTTGSSSSTVNAFLRIALFGIIGQLIARSILYKIVRKMRENGHFAHRTLILGGGVIGNQLATTLTQDKSYGLQPIGFLDDNPLIGEDEHAIRHLGDLSLIGNVLESENIHVLLIAYGSESEASLIDILRSCESFNCAIFIVPRLYEIHSHTGQGDHIGAIPVIRLRRGRFDNTSRAVKRIFDIAASGVALLALSPLLIMTAIAVRIEGGPGVLFRQERIGLDGRRFELLKFRSLKPQNEQESATNWNVANDNRMGPVGKFLRRSSIDELPQLWNILRGDMTIVGPRPERPHFVKLFSSEHPRYEHRHRMQAGLTGLAQVNGLRGDTSIADRARYDNYYIENWSLWLDIKIIIGTVRQVISRSGS